MDTPDRVYNSPANQFVATFMGILSMNLIKGTVVTHGDRSALQVGSQSFELPDRIHQSLSRLSTDALTLMLRPKDIFLGKGLDSEPVLNATIQAIESMGNEHMVYLIVQAQSMIAPADNAWNGHVGHYRYVTPSRFAYGGRIGHDMVFLRPPRQEVQESLPGLSRPTGFTAPKTSRQPLNLLSCHKKSACLVKNGDPSEINLT